MNDEQYLKTQDKVVKLICEASMLDIDGFLARNNEANAVAPIVDPTLWRKGAPRMENIKRAAESLKPAQQIWLDLLDSLSKADRERYEREDKLASMGVRILDGGKP